MTKLIKIEIILLCYFSLFLMNSSGLRLRGQWKSTEFYKFLVKFGFQQTDMNDKDNTLGYVYGNITSSHNSTIKLILTYSDYFYDLYENRKRKASTNGCTNMFTRIGKIAYDGECVVTASEDFIRTIPCPKNDVCLEERGDIKVIQNSQFTFRVLSEIQARFYFISFASCRHLQNTYPITGPESCHWQLNDDDTVIDYDIWLVNGNPQAKHSNPFEHQFSFELHNIFELYFVFFILYLFIVPVQIYALKKQPGLLPFLLVLSMSMSFMGIFFNLIHVLTFAFNGEGFPHLAIFGDFLDVLAQCVFMMTLLLIVKGYTITRDRISTRAKIVLMTAWTIYTAGSIALFFWNISAVDPLAEPDEWQTQPGFMILIFRLIIMAWFLLELRCSMEKEINSQMAEFYLHFGAGFLVWFVYLPILAVVSSHVSILWRHKTVVSVKSCADFVSFCVLIHLLWPSRNNLIFSFQRENQIVLDDYEFEALIDDAGPISNERTRNERNYKKQRSRPPTHKYVTNVTSVTNKNKEQNHDTSDADEDDSDYDSNMQNLNVSHSHKTKANGAIRNNFKHGKVDRTRSSEESEC